MTGYNSSRSPLHLQVFDSVYKMLSSQDFYDWYKTTFEEHIQEPDGEGPSKEMILNDIAGFIDQHIR